MTDDFCPWNAGLWQLSVPSEDGIATVTGTRAAPDLSMDIRDVAAVYLGAFRFAELAAAGRVRECRPGCRCGGCVVHDVVGPLELNDVLVGPLEAPENNRISPIDDLIRSR